MGKTGARGAMYEEMAMTEDKQHTPPASAGGAQETLPDSREWWQEVAQGLGIRCFDMQHALDAAWQDIQDWVRFGRELRAKVENPNFSPLTPTEAGIAKSEAVLQQIGAALKQVATPPVPATTGGAQETLRERIVAALKCVRLLDCGAHYCRYCSAKSPKWEHGVGCPYVESQRETEEAQALISALLATPPVPAWKSPASECGFVEHRNLTPPVPAERTETERLHDKEARAWRRGYEDGLAVGELVAAPLKADAATLRAQIEQLLAFGEQDKEAARLDQIRSQYEFYGGWVAAIQRVLAFIPTEDA